MRVNVYAEEMTDRVELVRKVVDGKEFTGIRFYMELPVTVRGQQVSGPFLHHPGDDDSAAITFWGKGKLAEILHKAGMLLWRQECRPADLGEPKATIIAGPNPPYPIP